MVLAVATWRLSNELSEGGPRHCIELKTAVKEQVVWSDCNHYPKFLNPHMSTPPLGGIVPKNGLPDIAR